MSLNNEVNANKPKLNLQITQNQQVRNSCLGKAGLALTLGAITVVAVTALGFLAFAFAATMPLSALVTLGALGVAGGLAAVIYVAISGGFIIKAAIAQNKAVMDMNTYLDYPPVLEVGEKKDVEIATDKEKQITQLANDFPRGTSIHLYHQDKPCVFSLEGKSDIEKEKQKDGLATTYVDNIYKYAGDQETINLILEEGRQSIHNGAVNDLMLKHLDEGRSVMMNGEAVGPIKVTLGEIVLEDVTENKGKPAEPLRLGGKIEALTDVEVLLPPVGKEQHRPHIATIRVKTTIDLETKQTTRQIVGKSADLPTRGLAALARMRMRNRPLRNQ